MTEMLMLKSHVERGLSMPPSDFFSNFLQFYGLQLHQILPNSLARYVAFCEGYLGIPPRVDLFFCVQPNIKDDESLHTCGTDSFVLQSTKEYPFIPPLDSAKGKRDSYFYMADKAVRGQTFGLRPFENVPAESRDSWRPVNDDSAIPYVSFLHGCSYIECCSSINMM
jgi:hypothetical protein